MRENMFKEYGVQAYLLTFAAIKTRHLKCTGIILVVN